MATVIPRIGQRSVLNSNLSGDMVSKTLTTNVVTADQYFSPQGRDIVFNTTDPAQSATGLLEQMRIDTSGNISYAGGHQIMDIQRDLKYVKLTTECYNKINDIYITIDWDFINNPYANGIRIMLMYENWGSKYVAVTGEVMCAITKEFGGFQPGYYCVGQFAKNNQAAPNEEYFDTSTTGLTVSNGTVQVSSVASSTMTEPYMLIFRFMPAFSDVRTATINLKIVSATIGQIMSIVVDSNPI